MSKPVECTIPRVNPNINSGLWVIMTCQCKITPGLKKKKKYHSRTKKMWYIYTMEYYSAIKKTEIMPLTATWMDLEIIILSEISQKRKANTI